MGNKTLVESYFFRTKKNFYRKEFSLVGYATAQRTSTDYCSMVKTKPKLKN